MEILSCSDQVLLHRDDTPLQSPLRTYKEHTGQVHDLSLSTPGKAMVSSGADGRLLVTNLDTGHLVQQFKEKQSISTGRLNRAGDTIATGGEEGVIRLYDIKRKRVDMLAPQDGPIRMLDWKTDTLLGSVNRGGEITIIDSSAATQDCDDPGTVCRLYNTCDTLCLRFSQPSLPLVATGQVDGSLTLWDINTRSVAYDIYSPSQNTLQAVNEIMFSPFNHVFMLSLSSDHTVRFYDVRQKKLVRSMAVEEGLSAGDFHNNGNTIGLGTLQGNLLVYDLRKELNRTVFQGHQGKRINRLLFLTRDNRPRDKPSASTHKPIQKQNSFPEVSLSNVKVVDEKNKVDISYSSYNKQNSQVIKANQSIQQQQASTPIIPKKEEEKERVKERVKEYENEKEKVAPEMTPQLKNYLKDILQEHQQHMSQQMQAGLQHLQVEMIRQFQVQLNQVQDLLKKELEDKHKVQQENEQLRAQLAQMRDTPFG